MIRLVLPYPPSANRYWRHPSRGTLAGRHLISRQGRAYREHVAAIVRASEPLTGRLDVHIELQPPDKRKRDLDNALKAAQDALTFSGVWADDEQIDRLSVFRRPPIKGGRMVVKIHEITEAA